MAENKRVVQLRADGDISVRVLREMKGGFFLGPAIEIAHQDLAPKDSIGEVCSALEKRINSAEDFGVKDIEEYCYPIYKEDFDVYYLGLIERSNKERPDFQDMLERLLVELIRLMDKINNFKEVLDIILPRSTSYGWRRLIVELVNGILEYEVCECEEKPMRKIACHC